jgi:hypothetical protein
MTPWTSPEFVEIDMSAEIGSYQEDTDPRDDDMDRLSSMSDTEAARG